MALFMIFIITSCKKENRSFFPELSSLTQEVLDKSTLLELKQAQAMLSIEERDQLWKTKLNFILKNNKEVFTKDQRKIVLMLKQFLDQNGIGKLLKDHTLSYNFMVTNLPYFEKHFSKEQLNLLIESPYLKNDMLISKITVADMQLLVAEPPTQHCTCKYDLGCSGAGNDCDVKGCKSNDELEMCGLFATESCTRRCEGIQPDLD